MQNDKRIEKLENLISYRPDIFYKVDVVVIGAGQAGLSAVYYLKKAG